MGERKVRVTIVGEQTDSEGQNGEVKLFTEGRLFTAGGLTRITYQDDEEAGTDGSETTVEMEGGGVAIFREGDYASHFVFRMGQKYLNRLQTPHGEIELGAFPLDVRYDIGEDGGEMFLRYELDMRGTPLGVNRVHMTWKEANRGI